MSQNETIAPHGGTLVNLIVEGPDAGSSPRKPSNHPEVK